MSDPQDRRRFYRHPIAVPLKINRTAVAVDPLESHSSDLSLGGLSFFWDDPLPKGEQVEIRIPAKDKEFEILAEVVYSEKQERSGHFRTGVTFLDPPSAFKAKLAEEVLEIMEFQKIISKKLGVEISEEECARQWIQEQAERFARR